MRIRSSSSPATFRVFSLIFTQYFSRFLPALFPLRLSSFPIPGRAPSPRLLLCHAGTKTHRSKAHVNIKARSPGLTARYLCPDLNRRPYEHLVTFCAGQGVKRANGSDAVAPIAFKGSIGVRVRVCVCRAARRRGECQRAIIHEGE